METYLTENLGNLGVSESKKLDRLLRSYRVFRLTYRDDPVAFVHDCIDWDEARGPALYQDEILGELPIRRRISARGPHGLGKTALAAWVNLWFALTRDVDTDWKAPITASAWRQLSKFLLPEIRLWARQLKWDKIGRPPFSPRTESLGLSLKLKTGEAFAVASDTPDLIEGAHGSALLYTLDEAKAIPDAIWDAIEGALSSGDCYALSISTPGPPHGRFHEIQSRKPGTEDWWVRHITLEEAIAAGRISRSWAEQRKRQWGESSAIYQNRVLGEFATSTAEGIIPLAWVEAAIDRWYQWEEQGFPGRFTGLGADIGGGDEGGDKTVFALAYDNVKIKELRKTARQDPLTATMETVGRIAGILGNLGGEAIVDVIGIGAGVLHRLIEMGRNARGFVASKKTSYTDMSGELGFANWRAAAWWITREMLAPNSGFNVCLPPDDELIGDLVAPKMSRITSKSKILVESKEQIRKRLRHSPDCADAVIQILVGPMLCDEEEESVERVRVSYEPVRIGRY